MNSYGFARSYKNAPTLNSDDTMPSITMKRRHERRAQSAMEYLMTYGWAILVIAIIVSLLFALGLFSGGSGTPSGCVPQSGFSCTNPSYGTNGISATISQDSGQYYLGAWVFVASSSEHISSSGLPVNFSASSANNMLYIGALTPSQSTTFYYTNTKAGDIPTNNVPVGYPFTGYIWLGYCTTPGCNSPTSFAKVGTINVKSSGSGSFGGSSTTTAPTSTTSTSSTSTSTTSIHYVAITLTNTQPYSNDYVPITIDNSNGATASNFQQMVSITPSSYQHYESAGLGNIRFYQGSTELHSWCESGCNSSSSSATFWVLMPNGVASGTTNINMTFLGVGTTYDGNYAGEAPQLSPAYAEYDNGAKVFGFYDNFKGTSLNATKWTTGIGSGGSITVDNGLTIVANGGSSGGVDTSITSNSGIVASTASLYVELLGEVQFNGPEEDLHLTTSVGGATASSRSSTTFFTYSYCPSSYTDGGSVTVNQNTLYMFSLYSNASASTTNVYTPSSYSVNYNSPTVSSTESVGTSCFGNINAVGIQDGHTAIWIRTREYPPNNVMPSVSFGTIVTPQATSSNFQQMLTIDSASYSSANEINSGWSNVEFTAVAPANSASNGNVPIYAWCESGCSNSSSGTIAWVNLGSTIIGVDNSITIYMNFMPTNVMSSSSSYTGEAPQLSPAYAEYDNGAKVFDNYWNFAGTIIPSGWTNSGVTVDNGLSVAAAPSSTAYAYYGTAIQASGTQIFDFYANMPTTATTDTTSIGLMSETTYLPGIMWQTNDWNGWTLQTENPIGHTENGVTGYQVGPQLSGGGTAIFSGYYTAGTSASFFYNYGASTTSTTDPLTSAQTSLYPGVIVTTGAQGFGNLYWFRTRAYPPNGQMPGTNLGLVH